MENQPSQGNNSLVVTGIIAVLISLGLYILDVSRGFNGFTDLGPNIGVWLMSLLAAPSIVTIAYVVLSRFGKWKLGLTTAILFAVFILFGLLNFGKGSNFFDWLKIALIFVLYQFFILPSLDSEDEQQQHTIYFILLLLADYFLLGSIGAVIGGGVSAIKRFYIPLYLLYVCGFFLYKTKSGVFTICLTFTVSWMLFSVAGGQQMFVPSTETGQSQIGDVLSSLSDFAKAILGIPLTIQQGFDRAMNDSFNIYPSQQEISENPQGVYLEKLEVGEIEYREGDPVRVWAKISARTLKEPIDMKISCQAIPSQKQFHPIDGIVDEAGNLKEVSQTVYTAAERSIPCIFSEETGNMLPGGRYNIEFNATFDFSAESELKIYLMNRERMIQDYDLLIGKGVEPTKENLLMSIYKIQDTKPISLTTSGPISVGIGTDKVPWDIGERNNPRPLFGITIGNIWTDGGSIEKINDLVFEVPQGFEIKQKSCDIDVTATGTSGGYTKYSIIPGEKDISRIQDIIDFRSFRCLMDVDISDIDNTPLTVRFLRAQVKYTYLLQEKIPVEVEVPDISIYGEEQAIVLRNAVCCEIIRGSSQSAITKYEWKSNEEECENLNDDYTLARQAGTNSLCEEWKCCGVRADSGIVDYKWVKTKQECDDLGNEAYFGSYLLSIEDYGKCPGVPG